MRETGLLDVVIPELLEGKGCTQNRFHKYDVYGHSLATLDGASGEAVLRLGALLHDVGKPRTREPKPDLPGEYSFYRHEYIGAEMAVTICQRLKLPNAERDSVERLVANHMFFYTPAVERRHRAPVPPPGGGGGAARAAGPARGRHRRPRFRRAPRSGDAGAAQRVADVMAADAALTVKDLAVGGRDVMQALAIPPGPEWVGFSKGCSSGCWTTRR